MRVFVTGATGFIGMAVSRELIAEGHQVLGLSRSAEKAAALAALGAEVLLGTVQDEALLKDGTARADAVIHLAFNHDFSTFQANCADDVRVVGVLTRALRGSSRRLLVTSGTAIAAAPDRPATETARAATGSPRAGSEHAVQDAARDGVVAAVVRLSQVHDIHRQGLISYVLRIGLEKGRLAYVGEGRQRWAAAPRDAVARLYRLAVEQARPGAIYHAVAEEGVAARDIMETLGERFDLPAVSVTPEEAQAHYGWLAHFAGLDMPASSAWTREALGWTPTGPTLLEDLAQAVPPDA